MGAPEVDGGNFIPITLDAGVVAAAVAPTLNAHFGDKMGLENQHINGGCGLFVAHSLRGEGFDASEDGTGRGTPLVPVAWSIMPQNSGKDYKARQVDVAQPLMAAGPGSGNQGGDLVQQPVAFDLNQITSPANRSQPDPAVHHTLPATSCPPHLATPWAVRRLTPVECERLQGFPDGFTRIPYRGKPADLCPDGPRYKALGNSWAVNCAEWIGERINEVESIQ